MAFPTSSLTNNQVHKEGNRAFVYDSALGVWDQVRETDRTENEILSGTIHPSTLGSGTIGTGVTLGTGVTFPAGHVVQVTTPVKNNTESSLSTSNNTWADSVITASVTPLYNNSDIMIFCQAGLNLGNSSSDAGFATRFKVVINSVTTYPLEASDWDQQGGTNYHSLFYTGSVMSAAHIQMCNKTYLHSNPLAGGTIYPITYTMQGAAYNHNFFQIGGAYAAQWIIYFAEIKR